MRNGLTMLGMEMALEFDKGLKYVGNDVYIWELAWVFQKRLKYVGNDVALWEIAEIRGEMT